MCAGGVLLLLPLPVAFRLNVCRQYLVHPVLFVCPLQV